MQTFRIGSYTAYVILIGMSYRPLDPESADEVENNGNDTLEEVPF
jgi:hypothetical protein